MSTKPDGKGRWRVGRRRGVSIETLETRALLTVASETFVAPSLTTLLTEARKGQNTSVAVISKLEASLQSQLESGPLADLNSGAVTNSGFVQEAQALEASFEQNPTVTKLPRTFTKIDVQALVVNQARLVVASLVAENTQATVGLTETSSLNAAFTKTISNLTSGPIKAIGTSSSTILGTASEITSELKTISSDLTDGTLTLSQAVQAAGADLEQFRAQIHAAIQVADPGFSGQVDYRINNVENAIQSGTTSSIPQSIKRFDNGIVGTTGLFGSKGAFSHLPSNVTSHPLGLLPQFPSYVTLVSGTNDTDGTVTLSANLAGLKGTPLIGQTISFTLDGVFAGVASSSYKGVATLSEVPTTDSVGTDTSGVVAYLSGTTNFVPSVGSGNLTIAAVATTLSSISGTATYGGSATLVATLANATSGAGLAGQTVSFSLDGTAVGTAVTNSSGVATLTGVPTTDSVGTDTSGVVAKFAGTTSLASSAGVGNLVVSQAATTLTNVSGSGGVGSTANLTATLISSTTGLGIANQTVTFTLSGSSVGSALTNSSGVATLTGVTDSNSIGTDTGAVVASFAGSGNYAAASAVAGDLVTSQNITSLTSVGGTSTFGSTASLTATLINSTTLGGITGKTVTFSLDGKVVGTATTNSSGVATLGGLSNSDAVGTVDNAVSVSFAGDSGNTASTGSGNLVVSAAGSTLENVSGSAVVGGKATLTAKLISGITGKPITGASLSFALDGTTVGTATTDSSGVATLTGVENSKSAGTDTGGVVVTFAGNTDYNSSTATGNLVVATSASTLSAVGGTASYGGTATVTAKLTDSTTTNPISGAAISFSVNGNYVGSATTNSSGVASLSGVANGNNAGTLSSAVSANFTGNTTEAASTGTGDLVVAKADTSVNSVSGTATGGLATLKATLLSNVTGAAVSNATIAFTLDGKDVGTATTDSTGVATLSDVSTSDATGTDTGGIVASYAGDSNYNTSSGTGSLVVS